MILASSKFLTWQRDCMSIITNYHRNVWNEYLMSNSSGPTCPSFESRIWRQSRPYTDNRGNTSYEHNSPIQVGEMVEPALGGSPMPVIKSGYRNLITRQELLTVLVTLNDGREIPREMAASTVRRVSSRP